MPRVATIVKNATTTIRKYGAKIANSKTLTVARCRLRNSGGKDGDNFLHNVHCICGNCYQAIMYGCNDINEEDKEFEETLIYDSWPKKGKK